MIYSESRLKYSSTESFVLKSEPEHSGYWTKNKTFSRNRLNRDFNDSAR